MLIRDGYCVVCADKLSMRRVSKKLMGNLDTEDTKMIESW